MSNGDNITVVHKTSRTGWVLLSTTLVVFSVVSVWVGLVLGSSLPASQTDPLVPTRIREWKKHTDERVLKPINEQLAGEIHSLRYDFQESSEQISRTMQALDRRLDAMADKGIVADAANGSTSSDEVRRADRTNLFGRN